MAASNAMSVETFPLPLHPSWFCKCGVMSYTTSSTTIQASSKGSRHPSHLYGRVGWEGRVALQERFLQPSASRVPCPLHPPRGDSICAAGHTGSHRSSPAEGAAQLYLSRGRRRIRRLSADCLTDSPALQLSHQNDCRREFGKSLTNLQTRCTLGRASTIHWFYKLKKNVLATPVKLTSRL